MAAVTTAQPQKALREDVAFEESVELGQHELRQFGFGMGLGLGEEGRGVLLHRAVIQDVLDAMIARAPAAAEKTCLVLIDSAEEDIEQVLASRRKLPSLSAPAPRLKARRVPA